MARIFEQPRDGSVAIRPSAGGAAFDRATSGALAAFWLSIGAIGVAAAAFWWYAKHANLDTPRILAAYAVALLAIVALFLLRRSLISMHLESRSKASADAMVTDYLDQLDDRFSVFRDVPCGEVWADHLVLGPSGLFAMQTATRIEKGMRPAHRDLDRAAAARVATENLLRQLVPMAAPHVEAVLVMAGSSGHDVARDPDGVWLVPADKIVAALLKRSSQSGAITRGVMDTGAFASESLQNAALEEALAVHLKAQMRGTLKHYAAPAVMTKG